MLERRLAMSERAVSTDDVGLVLGDDGVVYEVAANGTRTPLSSGSSSVLATSPVVMSSSEILNAYTTPKVIVAGVPGKVIMPVTSLGVFRTGAVPYDVSPAGSMLVGVANDNQFVTSTALGVLADGLLVATPAVGVTGSAALADWEGVPIVVTFVNGNPIDGDGTLSWTTYYVLLDVT